MELAGLFVGMGLFGLGFWAILLGFISLAFVLSPAVFLLLWILSKIPGVMPKAADPTMPKEDETNAETAKKGNPVTTRNFLKKGLATETVEDGNSATEDNLLS